MNKSLVDCHWLKEHLYNPNLKILDSSPQSNVSGLESEYKGKYIKGAIPFDIKGQFSDKNSAIPNTLLPADEFEESVRSLGINEDDDIMVYDNLGIYTSPRVWWMFKVMGHKNIAVLDGGLPEWIKCGYETVSDLSSNFSVGNFKAIFNKDLVKSSIDIIENLRSNDALVLDARSKGRFDGSAPEPREGLSSGHIPNSASLPFKEVLHEGKMKSKEELKKIFQSKNVSDAPLVFSCGSGLTACITYLAAEIALKNEKAVYDGSWTEWAQIQPGMIAKGLN